ncbi:Hypothetical protein A7982_00911 [Minicystis rosea]|nr:Hypothetical protein A7982_00911 [Minicystis rosea]
MVASATIAIGQAQRFQVMVGVSGSSARASMGEWSAPRAGGSRK